jgi:hypothetical protein
MLLLPAWTATREERTCRACGGVHQWFERYEFGDDIAECPMICPHCDQYGIEVTPLEPGELTHLELAAIEEQLWDEHWALWQDMQAPYL